MRSVIAGALALGLTAGSAFGQISMSGQDMVLGNPSAPVTVIEYASVGCPHCAAWAHEVFPAFKAKYIDTGKVRFVLREMLTGNGALAAAGFLLARCAGPANYFRVVDEVYAAQEKMEEQGANGPLLAIAKGVGLTEVQFKACESDASALAALQARSDRAALGTPTFVIGGRLIENEQSLADLDAAIAAARR